MNRNQCVLATIAILVTILCIILVTIEYQGNCVNINDLFNQVCYGYWETSRVFEDMTGLTKGRVYINSIQKTICNIMEYDTESSGTVSDYRLKSLSKTIVDNALILSGIIFIDNNTTDVRDQLFGNVFFKLNVLHGSMIMYKDDLVLLSLYKDNKATANVI